MRAIVIPWADELPVHIGEVGEGFRDLAASIGGSCQYVERVRVQALSPLVLCVDEEGLYSQKHNARASKLYPGPTGIKGDALVLAEGWVDGGMDFISLPDPEGALTQVKQEVR